MVDMVDVVVYSEVLRQEMVQHCFMSLSKKTKNVREQKRFLALSHIQRGKSVSEAADAVGVDTNTVYVWLQKVKASGIDGLREQGGRGRKQWLPKEKLSEFKEAVLKAQAERDGGRITGNDMIKLTQKSFGVSYTLSSIYKVCKKAGLSWVSARSVHPKASEAAQSTFKKTSLKPSKILFLTYPKIKFSSGIKMRCG